MARERDDRMERIDDVVAWYNQLTVAVNVGLASRLLNDAGRVRCIPSNVTDALGSIRHEVEQVSNRRLHDLSVMKENYEKMLQQVKAGGETATFTDALVGESLDDRLDERSSE